MKNQHRLTCILLACALSPISHAFSLSEAWNAARQYNTDYAAAHAEREAGQEHEKQGLAPLLPQIGATGGHLRTLPSAPVYAQSSTSKSYSVNLSQTLFDVARFVGYQKGQYNTQLADIRFKANEQQLHASVLQAYFDILQAQDTLAATVASKKAYSSQLEQAKLAFEVGVGTLIEVNEVEAGHDAALAKEIVDQNTLEVRRQQLQLLTGLNPLEVESVDALLPNIAANNKDLAQWLEQAQHSSLNIQAAELMLHLAESDISEKRAGHLPTLTLKASHGETQSSDRFNPLSRSNSVSLQLNIPLFNGGSTTSQVRAALSLKEVAQNRLESSRRQTREEVRKAYLGVSSGIQQIKAQENLIHSAKSKLASTRLGREVGIRTNLEVLQAEQGYYDALTGLAQAKYGYLGAYVQLGVAVGVISVTGK